LRIFDSVKQTKTNDMKGTYTNKRSKKQWIVDYLCEDGDVVMYTNDGRYQSRIISQNTLLENYTKNVS